MSNMLVSMRLQLLNEASGPIKEIISEIKNLDSELKEAIPNLSKVGDFMKSMKISRTTVNNVRDFRKEIRLAAETSPLIASLHKELNSLSGALAAVRDNSRGVGANLTSIGNRAGGASIAANRLDATLNLLDKTLSGLKTNLFGTADGFATVTHASRQSADVMSATMDKASGKVRNVRNEVNGLTESVKGMIATWGAWKIKGGLTNSTNAAAGYNNQVASMRALGIPEEQLAYAQKKAWETTQAIPQISVADALSARRSFIAGTGENNEALMAAALPHVLKNAYIYKSLYDPQGKVSVIASE